MTVFPIMAGAVGRLPAIDVKLNGVTAYTKPSSGRESSWFHIALLLIGCSLYSSCAYDGLNRQKSISSHAESISAWNTVFDWPSIVAAFTVARHVVVSSSAARRKTAARSSHAQFAQSAAARRDATIACSTCCVVARG